MCAFCLQVAVISNRLLRHCIIRLFNIKLTNLFIIQPILLRINLNLLSWFNAGLDGLDGLDGLVDRVGIFARLLV